LRFNQRIWDIFYSDWQSPRNTLPKEIKQDLLSLSIFVRRKTLDIMAYPESRKLDILVQINENLAKGLRAGMEASDKEAVAEQPEGEPSDASQPDTASQ
jgi:flagellar protein FlaF